MKYWEFLIQKEGDDTWLPLETQQVEILEGRYRVVAHTDRVETPVEIRVSQLVTSEMPPRKRVRKRTGNTNESGLVVVMPFVHLSPGRWDLKCSSPNVMDDFMGKGWQYGVQLQVFEANEDGDDWPVAQADEPLSDDAGAGSDAVINADLPLLQAQAQIQSQNEQDLQESEAVGYRDSLPQYGVVLKQQAFLAKGAQPMTIVGKVHSLLDTNQESTSQLGIRLQNPRNGHVIMEASRPLSLARLPAEFKVQVKLPTDVKTQVIVGEVSLRKVPVDPGDRATLLASTPFTITVGIDQLLDRLANRDSGQFEEDVSVFSNDEELPHDQGVSVEADVSTLNPTYKAVAPAVGVVLPPQLDRPLAAESDLPAPVTQSNGQANGRADSKIDLPAFPRSFKPQSTSATNFSSPSSEDSTQGASASAEHSSRAEVSPQRSPLTPPPMVSQPAQFMGTSIEDDDIETEQIAALLEDIDKDLHAPTSDFEGLEPPSVEETPSKPVSQKEAPPPVEQRTQSSVTDWQAGAQTAFQSLKMKDHFWQRLSSLTQQSHEEAAKRSRDIKAAGLSVNDENALAPQPSNSSPSGEVVVYDEPAAESSGRVASTPGSSTELEGTHSTPANVQPAVGGSVPMQFMGSSRDRPTGVTTSAAGSFPPEDLPEMALPVISVPMGDLVAGETIAVTVRTQPSVYKPFIKLWMVDRQSRSVVGEPQLLTNLTPDALGDLQVTAQLRVPKQCLDVQIAAIAIDMATQQESNKAVVNRHVVPAGQPSSQQRYRF